jgi:hypothetical protein
LKHRKYGNTKVTAADGSVYDSKREYARGRDLILLERCGEIRDLKRQVPIELIPKQKGERATTWVADFTYVIVATEEEVWEDAKGFKTEVYRIKRKLVLLRYGKKIKET